MLEVFYGLHITFLQRFKYLGVCVMEKRTSCLIFSRLAQKFAGPCGLDRDFQCPNFMFCFSFNLFMNKIDTKNGAAEYVEV